MGTSKSKAGAGSGAWKPRVVFWLLVAAVLGLAGREVFNVFERPSLRRCQWRDEEAGRFVIYERGRPGLRRAWLFIEPVEDAGPPVCFHSMESRDTQTGDLRWSADGGLLYAVRRREGGLEAGERPLWVYSFREGKLRVLNRAQLSPGIAGEVAGEAVLFRLINRHGGRGPVAVSWYETGKRGPYLFAWEITRWQQALPGG